MSGIKVLLDNNLVIGLLKSYPSAIAIFTTENLSFENCAISQITRMELLSYPQLQAEEERMIRGLLANLYHVR